MSAYNFGNVGYCLPIVQNLADYFTQQMNLFSSPGTLQALTSDANVNRRNLIMSRPDGKDIMLFLEFMSQEHCYQGTQYTASKSCTYDVCATGDENNRKKGIFIDRDMLQCLYDPTANAGAGAPYPQLSMTYSYAPGSLHRQICDRSEAEEVAERMASWMWEYALALNNYLWGALSGSYTAHTSASIPSDCIPHDAAGYGKGGWFDINGQLQTGQLEFIALSSEGAVYPRFHSDLQKFYLLNGMSGTPIIVHGLGAMYDYNIHRNMNGFCCNDAGVNGAALAQQIGGFYFLESRPRANTNSGVTQDSVLLWEPGSHQLIFDLDFIGPSFDEVEPEYERRIITDPRTGIPFYFVRNRTRCQVHDANTYNVIPPKFLLVSKPTNFDQCPEGSNQTVLMNIKQCTPTDCAGAPAWGPLGDPTTDQSTVSVPRAVLENLAARAGRSPEEMAGSLEALITGQQSRSAEQTAEQPKKQTRKGSAKK